ANRLYPGSIKEYGVASELLSEKFPPTIILHGDQDVLVNINDSYKLHDRLGELGVPCEMLVFEGTGHGEDVFYQEDIYDRICTFLDKVLK
ncbi:MAG: prolyl oligopeptidase family serine peptidase, partial [Christensenellaceae bacterium]|nr:prolyl oligopeptidase family serine peptidase [Christensenellaceae bacterium]